MRNSLAIPPALDYLHYYFGSCLSQGLQIARLVRAALAGGLQPLKEPLRQSTGSALAQARSAQGPWRGDPVKFANFVSRPAPSRGVMSLPSPLLLLLGLCWPWASLPLRRQAASHLRALNGPPRFPNPGAQAEPWRSEKLDLNTRNAENIRAVSATWLGTSLFTP